MRIILNYEDFKTLISGGVVEKDGTKIILSDIGYNVMIEEIEKSKSK